MSQRKTTKNFLITILCFFAIGACVSPVQQGNSLKIATSSGLSQGNLNKNIISWEDIPYAQPPVGNLRWRAPRPFEDQDRTIFARDNNGCLQEPSIYVYT